MNLADIKLAVQRQFGDTAGVQINGTDIARWSNDAQVDICRKTDALSSVVVIPSIVGTDTYPLGITDFLKISRVTYNGTDLNFVTWAQLNAWYPNRDVAPISTGTPTMYGYIGNKIVLYPAPDSVFNISLSYSARPAALVADIDIPSIPQEMHEDIVRYCLIRAYELDVNEPGIARVSADYSQRVNMAKGDLDYPLTEQYPSVRDLDGGYG